MYTESNAIQNLPQPGSSSTTDDLDLKIVGRAKLVVTFHRNAYGANAVSPNAKVA